MKHNRLIVLDPPGGPSAKDTHGILPERCRHRIACTAASSPTTKAHTHGEHGQNRTGLVKFREIPATELNTAGFSADKTV
jgi:hypothetical protein